MGIAAARRRRADSLPGDHVVRDAESGAEVAALWRSWRGTGLARFASGAEYRWDREGFWHPRYCWAGRDGKPLLTFIALMGFGRSYGMRVDPGAHALAELPVPVLLGGFTMAMISARRAAS